LLTLFSSSLIQKKSLSFNIFNFITLSTNLRTVHESTRKERFC